MIGTAMIPRGEVGLIFAELGRVAGIFTNEIYAGLIIVIALTTLLPPFVMKWFYGRFGDAMPPVVQIAEPRIATTKMSAVFSNFALMPACYDPRLLNYMVTDPGSLHFLL